MRPQTIGRILGIGVRVAGRAIGQSLTAAASPAATTAQPAQPRPVGARRPTTMDTTLGAGRVAAKATGSVVRGAGGFLRPFRRVAGILWLEVIGVIFLLPALAFAPTCWSSRASYAHGPDHLRFWASAALIVVFLYLGISSLWRAQRK